MNIIMLDSIALSNAIYKQGLVYDIPETRAKKWIDRGIAKEVPSNHPINRQPQQRRTTSLPHGNKS